MFNLNRQNFYFKMYFKDQNKNSNLRGLCVHLAVIICTLFI